METDGPDEVVKLLNKTFAGRYALDGELGRGGMATVYLAKETHPARRVAIKVLTPTLTDRLARKWFLREVAIASNLSHPHIVPIFAAGEAGNLLYYVMPYIEGESLGVRLIRERSLPLRDAIHIVRDVGGALAYAHSSNVIHRDIKPGNILLTSGHALVTDFGIAGGLCAACGGDPAVAGMALGTPGYMPPEQAMGLTEADPRSDVYSLARVLYVMLHGDLPDTDFTLEAERLARPYPARSVHAPRDTIPDAVGSALRRALSWDPAERFASVSEFVQGLTTDYRPRSVQTAGRTIWRRFANTIGSLR